MKAGGTEGFVGWLFLVVAVLLLPLALWNLLTGDFGGALFNGIGVALAFFLVRRAFRERAKARTSEASLRTETNNVPNQ